MSLTIRQIPDLIKSLLAAIITVIAPLLYNFLSGRLPGAPIESGQFSNTLIWIIFALFAGVSGNWLAREIAFKYSKIQTRTFKIRSIKFSIYTAFLIIFIAVFIFSNSI